MDALALLTLQIEWGADEALDAEPIDRVLAPVRPAPALAPATGGDAGPATIPGPPGVAPSRPSRRAPDIQVPAVAARGQAAAAQAAAALAEDLPGLRAAIAAFDGCGLRDTATHLVFAEGDPAAGLVIVGEVPDAEEDRTGRPFAGRPGLLLDRMLDSIGLDRGRLLLTPLIPWRPPGDRPPSDFHLSVCLPFLERLLVLVQPAHLLLMGSRPAKLIAGTTIRANAGWQRAVPAGLPPDTRALAMRHPSYLLSHLPARREAWSDLLLLRRTLDGDHKPADDITGA